MNPKDMRAAIDVHLSFGEVSADLASEARSKINDCEFAHGLAFVLGTLALTAGIALLLNQTIGGISLIVAAGMALFKAHRLSIEARGYRAIILAHMQRDEIRRQLSDTGGVS
jgi:hypothetical protein